jgi:hypothetical protein
VTGSEDPLTPEEEEVRRLLSEARHTSPTPPDVVDRLDRVLDDLTHEPAGAAPVVDLARRRRRVASLLVAAAAVVAVGVAVSQVVSPQPTSDSSQAGAAADRDTNAAQPESKSDGTLNDAPAPEPVTGSTEEKSGLFSLRRDELADDVNLARSRLPLDAQGQNFGYTPRSADRAAGAACNADQWGAGRFVPVLYGKVPAVLVFRRPVGDTQVADLFLCGGTEPVRSVTLPAP